MFFVLLATNSENLATSLPHSHRFSVPFCNQLHNRKAILSPTLLYLSFDTSSIPLTWCPAMLIYSKIAICWLCSSRYDGERPAAGHQDSFRWPELRVLRLRPGGVPCHGTTARLRHQDSLQTLPARALLRGVLGHRHRQAGQPWRGLPIRRRQPFGYGTWRLPA